MFTVCCLLLHGKVLLLKQCSQRHLTQCYAMLGNLLWLAKSLRLASNLGPLRDCLHWNFLHFE